MKAGDNKDFWQRMAKSYGLFMQHSRKLYDAICERMRPGLTRDMNVLELACGSGQFSFRLAGCVLLWEATDFSEIMIAEARKQPCLTGALRRCAIWRRVFRNDKECDP